MDSVSGPREESFYWITITFSQTFGTALGDWAADGGFGYSGSALLFGAGLPILAALYWLTPISRVLLFWAAFILTRPRGATVGDFFDKPRAHGGLEISRPLASLVSRWRYTLRADPRFNAPDAKLDFLARRVVAYQIDPLLSGP